VTGILPSSAQRRKLVDEYCADGHELVKRCLATSSSSAAFQEIYQLSLAAHTVLGNLSNHKLRPRVNPARSVVLRVPLLAGIGQASVAETELRRFVELILWALYFTDHSVEWNKFNQKTTSGFAQDARKPISYAAHRELGFYLEYAYELMENEPSGLGMKAVDEIKQSVRKLNAAVHAGRLARELGKILPHDQVTEPTFRNFCTIQRQTFASCCLLLAAYQRKSFDTLSASSRAHFDWLVGAKLRREVRKGPFGLP
jgi:hypothetical protein